MREIGARGSADADDRRLVEAARGMIARVDGDTSLEAAWLRAAAETLASGRAIDPPISVLEALTTPAQAWSTMPSWPTEAIDARAGRLADCHFLAIAEGNMAWLDQLDQGWSAAPPFVDDLLRLRAQGQIGLGMRPHVRRPHGWTADEIARLEEEKFLVRDAPSDGAWLALAEGDSERARLAIEEYERRIEQVERDWSAPGSALEEIWASPGIVLRTEGRALRALTSRM